MSKKAAVLGLGERGKSWARLFQSAGWRVVGFDPDPLAGAKSMPSMGWRKAETISSTVSHADWVLLCLPDRLELIQKVIQRAQAEAPETAVIAVNAISHDLEEVQNCSIRPGRVVLLSGRPDTGVDLHVGGRNHDDLKIDALAALSELGPDLIKPGISNVVDIAETGMKSA